MAVLHRATLTTFDASSQVRENHGACRTAHEISQPYRDEMVPLRKTIAEGKLHRYNGYRPACSSCSPSRATRSWLEISHLAPH